ncbi:MAG: FitA-like ribbon-helix-helix domain-containing protein [Actinomycetota bacterium]
MTKMIQIRNVPEDVHRALKVRAVGAGMSLSDYLLAEVAEIAERPTLEELVARLRRRRPVEARESSADIIRRHRDA